MKKIYILLAFIAILFGSCRMMKYSESVSVFDYNDHDYAGFLVFPTIPNENYKALSNINVNFYAGRYYKNMDTTNLRIVKAFDKLYTCHPKAKRVLNACIQEAKKFGANALIDFKIKSSTMQSASRPITVYTATGIAVKMKQ